MKLAGKKAIVTGANRSIGQAMAIALAEAGAEVVISYRSDEQGAMATVDAIRSMGQHGHALHADFSTLEGVHQFADAALGHLKCADILINNAAMLYRETLLELSPDKMQQIFQVNAVSPLYLSQLCAKNMIDHDTQGCILNISSIAASRSFPKGISYAASKAAMNKWTQNAALDLAQYGIRVNAIAPGVVESGMNENTAETNPELWDFHLKSIPLKRTGHPSDISNTALFLVSNEASWITGKIIEVDGGHVL